MGYYISSISLVHLRHAPGISLVYLKYITGISFISGISYAYLKYIPGTFKENHRYILGIP